MTTAAIPAAPPAAPLVRYREMELRVDRDALAKLTEAQQQRAEGEPIDDRIPVAISSETPVLRYDWWTDERYYEVLDHTPGAVDLSYARDGMPFLLEHNRREQHGILEEITVGADRVLRGMLRMSKAERSQEIRQDILDGIRKKVSGGYRLSEEYEQTPTKDAKSGIPTRRYRNWTPMECSAVSIPADYDVGYGRSAAHPAGAAVPEHLQSAFGAFLRSQGLAPAAPTPTAPTGQERAMSGTTTAPNGAEHGTTTASPDVRVTAVNEERQRADEIATLGAEHAVPADKIQAAIRSGKTLADFRADVIAELRARMAKPTPAAPGVELNDKERKQYSFARAIAEHLGDVKIDGKLVEGGFEREIGQELARKLPAEYTRRGGVLIPTVTGRAGLDSATATKGAETKFTQVGDFIDLLRARMKVRALGARVLSGLTGPVSMVKQTGAASGSWVGENSGADVADSNLLLGLVTLAIKTYQASTSFSRQLLISALSGSVDAEQMVRDDLAIIHALAFDRAALVGTGAANQPRGILNTAGISSVAIGANGGAPTYASIIDLETAVSNANADVDGMGYLSTPVMRGKLKQTQKFAGTNGAVVWDGKAEMNGYRAEVSTQVPNDLVKGTSVDCHAIAFGDWAQLVIGEWGVLELITDPFRLKKQGMIEVTSFQMGDVAVRTPESFAAIKDARNV